MFDHRKLNSPLRFSRRIKLFSMLVYLCSLFVLSAALLIIINYWRKKNDDRKKYAFSFVETN